MYLLQNHHGTNSVQYTVHHWIKSTPETMQCLELSKKESGKIWHRKPSPSSDNGYVTVLYTYIATVCIFLLLLVKQWKGICIGKIDSLGCISIFVPFVTVWYWTNWTLAGIGVKSEGDGGRGIKGPSSKIYSVKKWKGIPKKCRGCIHNPPPPRILTYAHE